MEKQCTSCLVIKPLIAFHRAKSGKLGRRAMCSDCCKRRYDTPERLKRSQIRRQELRESDPAVRRRENELCRIGNEKNIINYLLRGARSRCKISGLQCTVTSADIKLVHICPLLGIPLKIAKGVGNANANSYSLDRIDNSKGYIPGNVWIISRRANLIKSDATLEELEKITQGLKINHN